MEATLLAVGLVSLVAAIVGGGLNMLGIQLPVLRSVRRQVILGVVGVVLIAIALRGQWAPASDSADNAASSEDAVASTPSEPSREEAPNLNAAQGAADITTPDGSSFQNDTQEAQYRMIALGYDVGYPDGFGGPKTTAALAQVQREYDLPLSGTADAVTLDALRARSRKAFLDLLGKEGEGSTDYQRRWLPALTE